MAVYKISIADGEVRASMLMGRPLQVVAFSKAPHAPGTAKRMVLALAEHAEKIRHSEERLKIAQVHLQEDSDASNR